MAALRHRSGIARLPLRADAIDLPVDLDHATVKKALFGDAAPAVGWINKLEARADGLYGRVEWLDEGLRVLRPGRIATFPHP